MSSIRLAFALIFPLITLVPTIPAQHQPRDWYCVRQPFLETTNGDVVVLQCVAALPKGETLDADDDGTLTKLEVDRQNVRTFREAGTKDPKNWPPDDPSFIELVKSQRMGFGQRVGLLCQKHPNIVLAPLFPDLTSGTATLYGCKNIIAAPEK
jgi:hypothetical protein